ncbi:hypothetical protein [Gemella cuniculi]|uniref:hypothetical protein n=1 Tax=Gemella cuniculi TaxID=150240 RepID=UPI0004108D4E|nr:hypothetical protein [Gemella cuniculi]
MKKVYNYLSYCIYSFIPLYVFLLVYSLIKQDMDDVILILILIIYSVSSLIAVSYMKPNNIFVCAKKEVSKSNGIDYGYLILMIVITFLVINEKLDFSFKILFFLSLCFLLNFMSFKYKSYTLLLLGYKSYIIRDKIVYSKRDFKELNKILKEKKSLQVIEISDNIYLEKEKYSFTNFYCKDC